MQVFKKTALVCAAAIVAGGVAGCGSVELQARQNASTAMQHITQEQAKADVPVPVVTSTPAAWLLGQSVDVLPAKSPLLSRVVIYHPAQRVMLNDVAAWISQASGLVVDTVEAQSAPGAAGGMQALAAAAFPIAYEGPLSGLLDATANKAGLFWKFDSGRISFYRTMTRTFYIPALARNSSGTSSISTGGAPGAGANSSGGNGVASSAGGQSGSPSGQSTLSGGGASSTASYAVDVWAELEKTAKIVGDGAHVIANKSFASVTVTGTPAQVRNVEEWTKSLAENLSQQVAITVQVFRVKTTEEENYNWNPDIVFKGLSTKYGFNLSGPQAPPIVSGDTPLNFAAAVLPTAYGSQAQYTGSQLAVQALSKLGRVSESVKQTVITLNGQPAPLQVANQTSYLQSSTQSLQPASNGAAPVAPTLTPGVVTTGFTAIFLPQIVNGKVLLSMDLTNSTLIRMGSVSSGGSSIQTPNIDLSTFQQSVSLTPGDTLLLTGFQQDSGAINQSGAGAPNNYAFGGGVGNSAGKQLIAIVITAKVL